MAKIKDFAKDLGLDLKDALELIERAGVKAKANATTIDDGDMSTVLHVFTTERATKNMNKYLNGEAVIPSAKAKKAKASGQPSVVSDQMARLSKQTTKYKSERK